MTSLIDLSKDLNVSKDYVEEINNIKLPLDKILIYINKYNNYINYDYNRLCGRLYIYFSIIYSPKTVSQYLETSSDYLNEKTKDFLNKYKKELDQILLEDDFYNYKNYDYFSSRTVVSYLLKSKSCLSICETPCIMFLRQAVELYSHNYDEVINCYRELINQEYVHASPVMFNAGTRKPQMSSCFLTEAGDSLESLFGLASKMANITKNNGATGVNLSNIRHSSISNSGNSGGCIPFGKIYDQILTSIDQGGKRNGSGTFYLRMFHLDIEEHIGMKDYTVDIENKYDTAMICVLTNGLFFERYNKSEIGKKDWTLFCPKKAEMKTNIHFNYKTDKKEKINYYNTDIYNAYLAEEHVVRLFDCYGFELDFWYPIFELEGERRELEVEELKVKLLEEETKNIYNKELRKELNDKKIKLFNTKKINCIELMDKIQSAQIKSSNPFMVNEDSINYMNNTKKIGEDIRCSNLCLEITLPCNENEIASCNLGNINLKKYVLGKIDDKFLNNNIIDDKSEVLFLEELARKYDFDGLGKATRSLVRNINKIIDNNHYLGDEFKIPNLKNRPLGIGASGLGNVLYLMNICYVSDQCKLLNEMIFGCIYFNATYESCMLSQKDGEYENFRKGEYFRYDTSSKSFIKMKGSPYSNGTLQFDLWKENYEYKYDIGRLTKDRFNNLMKDIIRIIHPSFFLENNKFRYFDKENKDVDWDDLSEMMKKGMRNSMLIALMPTATSAQILNNTENVELHTRNIYTRNINNGEFTVVNLEMMEELKEMEMWNIDVFNYIKSKDGCISELDKFLDSNNIIYNKDKLDYMKKKYISMHDTKLSWNLELVKIRGFFVCHSESHNVFGGLIDRQKLIAYHILSEIYSVKTAMYYLHQLDTRIRNALLVEDKKVNVCSRENKDCLSCQ